MFIIPEHCVWPKMCLSLDRNQLSFTRQKQLSHAAFEHQSAAIPSGGSTSLEWCPGTPALLPPSRIWAEGPCPKTEAHWHMFNHLKSICSLCSMSMRYLWPGDYFHVVHKPSEWGRHLVYDAVKQKLLSTMEHEPSTHNQDGTVHLTLGFIWSCQENRSCDLNSQPSVMFNSVNENHFMWYFYLYIDYLKTYLPTNGLIY